MAAYNVAGYIDEAIQSVLAQKGASFELLIGDDASTDGTWERIEGYRNDPRIRAWRFLRQREVGLVRNQLVAWALGSYLLICDADDLLSLGYLQSMSRMVIRNEHVGVVYADRLNFRDGEANFESYRIRGPEETWDLLWDHVPDGGTLIQRSVFLKAGGYRPGSAFMPDYDLFLRLAEITPFQKVGSKTKYLRRKRPGSLSDVPSLTRQKMVHQILKGAILRRYGIRVPW